MSPGPQARRVTVGAQTIHVVEDGGGEPVLLLHGFPDSHVLWRHQVPALTAAGLRVLAPDLPGFGESDRPDDVDAYRVANLSGIMLGVLDALGIARCHVVGHDFGAVAAWVLAALAPERVASVCALSVGHPSGYFTVPRQRELSWYMLVLASDDAEDLLRADDFRLLRRFVHGGDIDRYVRDLSRHGALRSALNLYRANARPGLFLQPPPALPAIRCPAMGVWSDGDRACTEEAMLLSERYVEGPWRYERIEGAGHWIPIDAPDRLNGLLLDFLTPA